jgi:hypothetical protein
MCRIVSQGSKLCYVGKVLTPKKCHLMPQNGPKGSRPQFSKLGPATKMALQVDSSNFFHSERIKIDEKQYNDPIHGSYLPI